MLNQLSLLFISSLLILLTSCAQELPPTKVTLLQPLPYKITVQSVEQPTEINLLSEEERLLALQGKAAEFNRIEKANVDAITAYIEKYRPDPVMFEYVEKAKIEREKKCAKIAGFYQAMPTQYLIISELSKDYSYSCPYVVARFISIMENNPHN